MQLQQLYQPENPMGKMGDFGMSSFAAISDARARSDAGKDTKKTPGGALISAMGGGAAFASMGQAMAAGGKAGILGGGWGVGIGMAVGGLDYYLG